MSIEKRRFSRNVKYVGLGLLLAYLIMAPIAMANGLTPTTSGDAQGQICGVMGKVHSILKVASVLIVTVAIIFAGYQIAFAHKRISDVAPILIGGLLIGAAGQIAVMVIGNGDFSKDCNSTAYVLQIDDARNA